MDDKQEYSAKDGKAYSKPKADESEQLAREEARKKTNLAREKEIEKGQEANAIKRGEIRAKEDIEELAKDKARKEAYIVSEKAIAEALEKRLKGNKQ